MCIMVVLVCENSHIYKMVCLFNSRYTGRDNTNANCSAGQVLAQGVELPDHLGPYPGGVRMGTGSDGALC
jgi:hypothetical protein